MKNLFSWTDVEGIEYDLESIGDVACNQPNPMWMSYSVKIENKTQLPIIKVNYGPMVGEGQKARIKISGLTCYQSNDQRKYNVKNHVETLEKQLNNVNDTIDAIVKDAIDIQDRKLLDVQVIKLSAA